jgi:serine/threonine protein kinase
MFYHMVTGSPPYFSNSAVEVVSQHINAPVPDPIQSAPGTPPQIAAIIQRMMAKDPNERHQNCAELVRELDAFLTGGGAAMFVPDAAAPTPRSSRLAAHRAGARKGTPWGIIVGVVAVVLALAAAGAYVLVSMGVIKWPLEF